MSFTLRIIVGNAISIILTVAAQDWLINHIQGVDKRYGSRLNMNGIR